MSQAPLILLPILASLALDVSFYSANMILQVKPLDFCKADYHKTIC